MQDAYKNNHFMFKWLNVSSLDIREAIITSLNQHFEADFLWKVSLKILNSGLILKTFTHEDAQRYNVTATGNEQNRRPVYKGYFFFI